MSSSALLRTLFPIMPSICWLSTTVAGVPSRGAAAGASGAASAGCSVDWDSCLPLLPGDISPAATALNAITAAANIWTRLPMAAPHPHDRAGQRVWGGEVPVGRAAQVQFVHYSFDRAL